MEKTFAYETIGARAYKASTENYTAMVIRDGKEFECYLKKHYEDGNTPYMFMYSVPIDQDPICEVVDTAITIAEDYDFLFEDEHWMTPCSAPTFHPNLLLHTCGDCGETITAGDSFCHSCGHKLSWETLTIDE